MPRKPLTPAERKVMLANLKKGREIRAANLKKKKK